MVLRKITYENSVRYIPKTEQTREQNILNQTKKRKIQLLENKIKIFHKTVRNSLECASTRTWKTQLNKDLLLLIKKHTDTLIEQTNTKPKEFLEFKMNEQMQTFSFSPPTSLIEEGKCFLGVSSFECTTSVFNITNGNNSF